MTGLTIDWFDPQSAGERRLRSWYDLAVAAHRDWSDQAPPDFDTAVTGLRNPQAGFGPALLWIAEQDGDVAGFGRSRLLEHESSHVAFAEITVRPALRRRGIGTAMLEFLLPELRARGRTRIESWSVLRDGPGEHWATRYGFQTVHAAALQRLDIAAIDRARWNVPIPAGYRLVCWTGTAPDDVVASFAHARDAIHDAPIGAVGYTNPKWTPERVRETEADAIRGGERRRVVAAVAEADESVAGFTTRICATS